MAYAVRNCNINLTAHTTRCYEIHVASARTHSASGISASQRAQLLKKYFLSFLPVPHTWSFLSFFNLRKCKAFIHTLQSIVFFCWNRIDSLKWPRLVRCETRIYTLKNEQSSIKRKSKEISQGSFQCSILWIRIGYCLCWRVTDSRISTMSTRIRKLYVAKFQLWKTSRLSKYCCAFQNLKRAWVKKTVYRRSNHRFSP